MQRRNFLIYFFLLLILIVSQCKSPFAPENISNKPTVQFRYERVEPGADPEKIEVSGSILNFDYGGVNFKYRYTGNNRWEGEKDLYYGGPYYIVTLDFLGNPPYPRNTARKIFAKTIQQNEWVELDKYGIVYDLEWAVFYVTSHGIRK